ncbi:hypothetical protein UG55_1010111 [Frankia sp. EI5c]|uniref:hypothetical protein n=1 Tax=Frankia sp. EI5c TaxID=683316 RepID=UPI0007C2A37F|nr:hypothetical protein [Frankia sp. EI5c]OAA27095.1 hypothetical protein UG55_1010111 [Frankia sp. EI5c]
MRSVTVRSGREDGMTVCGLLRLDGADVRRSELTGMLAASSIGLPAARRVHLDGSFGVVTAAADAAGVLPTVLVGPSGLVIVIADHSVGARVVPVGTGTPRTAGLAEVPRPVARTEAASPGFGSVTVLRPAGPGGPLPRSRSGQDERPGSDRADDAGAEPGGSDGAAAGPGGAGSGSGADLRGERDRGSRAAAALMGAYRSAGQRAFAVLGEHLLAVVWEPARRQLIVSRGGRRADDLVIWSDGRYFAFGVEAAQVLAAGPVGAARPRRLAAGETLPVTVATRLRRPPTAAYSRMRAGAADAPVT